MKLETWLAMEEREQEGAALRRLLGLQILLTSDPSPSPAVRLSSLTYLQHASCFMVTWSRAFHASSHTPIHTHTLTCTHVDLSSPTLTLTHK